MKLNRVPENCAYTSQHGNPQPAQTIAAAPSSGLGLLNSGTLVITPSAQIFSEINSALHDLPRIAQYSFPDQDLLSDVFNGRWVSLPYVYNALKTLRWEGVHSDIWRDEEVKAVHYIFAKKPWHEKVETPEAFAALDEPGKWWEEANWERKQLEIE